MPVGLLISGDTPVAEALRRSSPNSEFQWAHGDVGNQRQCGAGEVSELLVAFPRGGAALTLAMIPAA